MLFWPEKIFELCRPAVLEGRCQRNVPLRTFCNCGLTCCGSENPNRILSEYLVISATLIPGKSTFEK